MTAKIVRQHQIREGAIFSQWDDNTFTIHRESDNKLESKPPVIGHIQYKKETDFENYPQYTLFMERIAYNAWGYSYKHARIKDLLPPLPPPVIKAKDYRKRKESTNETD